MKKKKLYIMPSVSFEELENESPLCDISAEAHGQGSGHTEDRPGTAKAGDFCLDDDFVGPIEAANNNFEYSIDFDF